MDIKEFTGKHGESCSKCGYCAIMWKFVERGGGTPMQYNSEGELVPAKNEDGSPYREFEYCPDHILKTCQRCGYYWREHTKDAKS